MNGKFKAYYFTAIVSLIFSITAFTYNAWRLEASEKNSNIRTASFEVLLQLSEFEQIIFAAYYDKDTVKGNPRVGWVKVGLICDLSLIISTDVDHLAQSLKQQWHVKWNKIDSDQAAVDSLVKAADEIRRQIKQKLVSLE